MVNEGRGPLEDFSLVREGQYYQFWRRTDADSVIVIFASRNDRPPKFTFWKKALGVNAHVVFLNCDVPAWFRTGVPGLSDSPAGLAGVLTNFAVDVAARRVVTIGSSMGGYGALLTGSFIGNCQSLVFGVEPILGVPGGKTEITRNRYQGIYPDLVSTRRVTGGLLCYGGMDINDILGASMLRNVGMEIACISQAEHDTPDFLARDGRLEKMFSDAANGNSFARPSLPNGPAEDDEVVQALWALNEPFAAKNWAVLLKSSSDFASLESRCNLIVYLRAIAHLRNNQNTEALELLEKFISVERFYWQAWNALSTVYLKLRMPAEAVIASVNAIKLRPQRSIAHIQAGHAYRGMKSFDMAFQHYEMACKLNWSQQHYFDAANSVGGQIGRMVGLPEEYRLHHTENTKSIMSQFADYRLEKTLPI